MEYRQNDQLRLAAEFVQNTNSNIFLTGKAGTGKTTFLHNLKTITPKRMVVVAPTGVAAINAGGVTIHSFFQLNFAPAIPGTALHENRRLNGEGFQRKFNREKIRLIKCLDLLVIDEVSMVRSDILDAVDEVLRKYRNHSKPFGGVQLLMIGDLHQLAPIVKEDEWNMLRNYYPSIFFFDSIALKKSSLVTIELKEIFRQSDHTFITLLNKVRENRTDPDTIDEINARYVHRFTPDDNEGYITLTTHNATASNINRQKLESLKSVSRFYTAKTEGLFPAHDYPTEQNLELKTGSQVMFIKNDLSAEKRYYNGKIGKITRIENDSVFVSCPCEPAEIEAGPVTWENIKYALNEETREITEEVVGTFTQIPLKLAWAITIHKSQGLTFDKVIIDANAAFASGQVYVALSRCKTFEGIVLSTLISGSGIRTDATVMNYSRDIQRREPGDRQLAEAKHKFQSELILELFDFTGVKYRLEGLLKLALEHATILEDGLPDELKTRKSAIIKDIYDVALKFRQQLNSLLSPDTLPEENPHLRDRIIKGTAYFHTLINNHLLDFLGSFRIDLDNKAVGKALSESLEKLHKEVFIKSECLAKCRNGFETISYLRARSDAEVDFRPPARHKAQRAARSGIPNPELYETIIQWRDNLSEEQGIPMYMVLPNKTIRELVKVLPANPAGLRAIKGLGQVRINQYGSDLLSIIKEYCDANDIIPGQVGASDPEKRTKRKIYNK